MASKITLKTTSEFQVTLEKVAGKADDIAKRAVYVGAGIMADQVKSNIRALQTDKGRVLKDNEKFNVVTKKQKADLEAGLGISPISVDRDGNINAKVGFDGYGSVPSEKYPNGLPIPLLARAVESGSSVRQKKPFIRPAISQARNKAKEAMAKVIDTEIEKIMGGK